jgi:hypothetical protein
LVLERPLVREYLRRLRVRVGVFTRTEEIPLLSGWALEGTKTSHPARACGI